MASLITSVSAWGKLDESHLYNQRSNWRSFPSLVFPFKSAGGGTGASKGMECLVFRFRFAFIYSDLLSLIIGRFEPNFIPGTNRAKCPLPSLFPFPPFFGPSVLEPFVFNLVVVRSPQVIDSPESCGACSGCNCLRCIGRAHAGLGPCSRRHFHSWPPA